MTTRLLLAVVTSLCVGLGSAAADSIRCPGGIVQTGDTKLDLLGKCGEPSYAEAGPAVERAARHDFAPGAAIEEWMRWSVEHWTYDLGPSLFMQHVEIAGGRVASVTAGKRGSATEPRPAVLLRARCDAAAIRPGDRAGEVVAACGEPAVRDGALRTRVERVRLSPVDAERLTVTLPLELWVFDFGPQRFSALVLLEDGVVRAVERGGYGYAPAR